MQMQLLNLIVWPKLDKFTPQIIKFELGKLNVITGESRTGKSAIIPIIDYCLASSDCFIPIDTIRDHASWYGIVIQTKNEQILIARKVPIGNKVSNDFYLLRGDTIDIPTKIEEKNENADGIKNILNTIASVPYFKLDGDDGQKKYNARLGFRDTVALIFQNQDIVANQNIFFYKTHAHEHRERLRNWFPFILGAENIEILKNRQRLQDVEKQLRQLQREFDKVQKVSSLWISNMLVHLQKAKEYGLLDNIIIDETKPESLIAVAKDILNNIPDYSQTKTDNIEQANQEILEWEREEERISAEIGIIKKRLNDVKQLKSGLIDYSDSVKHRVERLHISQWLKDIASNAQECPACGSHEHPNNNTELIKISNAFNKYEAESKIIAEVPTSFIREEERLKSELGKLLEQKKNYQKRFSLLAAQDKKVQAEFQRRKSMFFFLGHLKASLETFESLAEGGELQNKISALETEYNELVQSIDIHEVQRRVNNAIAKISQKTLGHLKTLDIEDKYREIAPKFSITDLNIAVLSNDGNWHFLAEIGSASNWVSFHIALMCALQEYFIEQTTSCVASFVIFDQPSQVYFPKLRKGAEFDNNYDEDVEAVKSMFVTIAHSIKEKQGAWQSIILDHADSSIYGGIEGVYEVVEWRKGKKLIPEEWQ